LELLILCKVIGKWVGEEGEEAEGKEFRGEEGVDVAVTEQPISVAVRVGGGCYLGSAESFEVGRRVPETSRG
jgi:hypothetical protein